MAYIPEGKIPATTSTAQATTTQETGVGFNSAARAFGQTVLPLTNYAEGPGSDTITPLPQNANISILTPQQMSALGPQLPERPKVKFGELNRSRDAEYSAILDGVKTTARLQMRYVITFLMSSDAMAQYSVKSRRTNARRG
jgi:hypothetical protein